MARRSTEEPIKRPLPNQEVFYKGRKIGIVNPRITYLKDSMVSVILNDGSKRFLNIDTWNLVFRDPPSEPPAPDPYTEALEGRLKEAVILHIGAKKV